MEFDWRRSLYPRKLSFVPQVEERTNAIFGVKVAVVLDKSESAFDISGYLQHLVDLGALPFASVAGHVDDCLLAHNLSEAVAILRKQFVSRIRAETAYIDVGCPISIVQDLVETTAPTIRSAPPGRNRGRDGWIRLRPCPEISDGVLATRQSANLLVIWQLSGEWRRICAPITRGLSRDKDGWLIAVNGGLWAQLFR